MREHVDTGGENGENNGRSKRYNRAIMAVLRLGADIFYSQDGFAKKTSRNKADIFFHGSQKPFSSPSSAHLRHIVEPDLEAGASLPQMGTFERVVFCGPLSETAVLALLPSLHLGEIHSHQSVGHGLLVQVVAVPSDEGGHVVTCGRGAPFYSPPWTLA